MHPQTIYTKTSKGLLEIRNKTVKLSRDLNRLFLLVDGKVTRFRDYSDKAVRLAPVFEATAG